MEFRCINNHFQYRCLDYGQYGPVFESRQDQAIFVFQNGPDSPWAPPILLFGGYRSSFPGVKLSGREVHNSPYIAEVKNEWSYTSAPSICLRGMDRDSFTIFTFHHFIVLSRPATKTHKLYVRVKCQHLNTMP